jgi:hypothetical protein
VPHELCRPRSSAPSHPPGACAPPSTPAIRSSPRPTPRSAPGASRSTSRKGSRRGSASRSSWSCSTPPAKSVDAVTEDRADIGFFAIDPKRGESIAFTAPYVLIEGCYAVRDGSPLQANEEVDRPGTRVVVGQGSAYDLHLSRALKHAEIVRAPSSPAVVEHSSPSRRTSPPA